MHKKQSAFCGGRISFHKFYFITVTPYVVLPRVTTRTVR